MVCVFLLAGFHLEDQLLCLVALWGLYLGGACMRLLEPEDLQGPLLSALPFRGAAGSYRAFSVVAPHFWNSLSRKV